MKISEKSFCVTMGDEPRSMRSRAAFFDEPQIVTENVEFQLDSAYQGEDGIEILRQSLAKGLPYAMAFIDVRMPPGIGRHRDGIRGSGTFIPDLQVVICTAYSDYSWEEMIGKIGNSDRLLILKKPFEAIEVLQLVHALTKKWALSHALTVRLADLEVLVGERTHELASTNDHLRAEMAERIRADGQVREQAALLDNARDAILVRDLDDVVLYWNGSAERLYGWTAQEMVGRKTTDVLYKDSFSFIAAKRQLMEQGSWIGEFRHATKDGREITIEAHWTLVRR